MKKLTWGIIYPFLQTTLSIAIGLTTLLICLGQQQSFYPRPQLQMASWTNLNGPWDYAILAKEASRPVAWRGKIEMPYTLNHQRKQARQLLHFGAVAQELCDAIYTQPYDPEPEENGLMTYDREVMKIPVEKTRMTKQSVTKEN